MNSNVDKLVQKNLKYAKACSTVMKNVNKIRKRERAESIRFMEENYDKKINQISREDLNFFRETSMKNIVEMIKYTKQTEQQMTAKMIELINQKSVIEKENIVYCPTTTTKSNKGRKRKLTLQQQVV